MSSTPETNLALSRILLMKGYSPRVAIVDVAGGHKVTITDVEHPKGQSFTVYDGGEQVDVYADTDLNMTIKSASGGVSMVTAQQVADMLKNGLRVRLLWDAYGTGDRYIYAYPYSKSENSVSFFTVAPHSQKINVASLSATGSATTLTVAYYPIADIVMNG